MKGRFEKRCDIAPTEDLKFTCRRKGFEYEQGRLSITFATTTTKRLQLDSVRDRSKEVSRGSKISRNMTYSSSQGRG
ncbi:MAG: hypothetical protein DRN15_06195 [Thermoprotei archaeon]|nr:MAG: hypothetical protein DRN15_06195 [Thermoprotei archaeon]